MVYLPPVFTEARPEVLIEHIERHDFGLLVTLGGDGLIASHIPFLLDRQDDGLWLHGHLARPNPQVAHLGEGGEALAIFHGPHAYVSPRWYASGPSVPTWNYADVHAYGPVRRVDDPGWLRAVLRRLTERQEAQSPIPWRIEEQPEDYLEGMLKGIVGFEMRVNRLEGKYKLSQNRPAADRPRVIAELEHRGGDDARAVAVLMRQRERR